MDPESPHQRLRRSREDLRTDLLLGEIGLLTVQRRSDIPTAIRPVAYLAMIGIQLFGLIEIPSPDGRPSPQEGRSPEAGREDISRAKG